MSTIFILCLLFVIVLIVYRTVVNGISPMPSSPKAKRCLLASLPPTLDGAIFELGAGWGTLAFPIARKYPNCPVIACETSLIPYLFCRFRHVLDPLSNLRIFYRDIYRQPLHEAVLVVCYLYPGAMMRLKDKFTQELKPGTLIVSNTFAVPGWKESDAFDTHDLYHSKIYRYVITAPKIHRFDRL